MIKLKRAYQKPGPDDGYRILVDGLWPRGLSKEQLKIDSWMKEVAVSSELRNWFGHDPAKWEEFCRKYRDELKNKGNLVEQLISRAKRGNLTIVYGAKNEKQNNAVVLKEFLEEKFS